MNFQCSLVLIAFGWGQMAGTAILVGLVFFGCHRPTVTRIHQQEVTSISRKEIPQKKQKPKPNIQHGLASWYGPGFHGRLTASGETYDQDALTAAHRTLPFGTAVRVTNKKNHRSVTVRINDRGPYSGKRIIDLSKAAAEQIGMIEDGVIRVTVKVLRRGR